ncbi:hypothetical protein TH61_02780 [Rufibacter sp. DG15C]|uniref:YIP1 family protein n=1 Tax=Rufibacter sp. DG15C TaxID=1379909 RepID=UPI00078C621E|nr:YIP1 family protein [Rufibacter sp. DG15C]AMM50318.1 hypothetical protein TH61_02780 [Rufibacter sp. DG15C]
MPGGNQLVEHESLEIDRENILVSIWLSPTDTLQYILRYCPHQHLTILFILGGIVRAIDRASAQNAGDRLPTYAVILFSVAGGALFGWMFYYLYAWALRVTGGWLGGKAKLYEFRTVLAWSLVPSIASLFLLLPEILIFEDDVFKSSSSEASTFHSTMWIVFGAMQLTLNIWTFVILVNGISIIQNFSSARATFNAILPGLVLFVPFLLSLIFSYLLQ